MADPAPLRLYDFLRSGNCYKVRLLLTQLAIPYERHEVQLRMTAETARWFRAIAALPRRPAGPGARAAVDVAVVRAWVRYFGVPAGKEQELEERRGRGYVALDVMEEHLRGHAFMAGERYSIADIALYAYTHVADEGGFSLERHGAIRAWLDRVRAQPGHVPMSAG